MGDARDFLGVAADLFNFQGDSQAVVLLLDVAEIVPQRPVRGEQLVSVMNQAIHPVPILLKQKTVSFGRALLGRIDVTGDGRDDLVVSAPGASVNGDGTGAVFVFEGGTLVPGKNEPKAIMVGDERERSLFGIDLGASKKTNNSTVISIGAPGSYRTGTSNGTAYRWSF